MLYLRCCGLPPNDLTSPTGSVRTGSPTTKGWTRNWLMTAASPRPQHSPESQSTVVALRLLAGVYDYLRIGRWKASGKHSLWMVAPRRNCFSLLDYWFRLNPKYGKRHNYWVCRICPARAVLAEMTKRVKLRTAAAVGPGSSGSVKALTARSSSVQTAAKVLTAFTRGVVHSWLRGEALLRTALHRIPCIRTCAPASWSMPCNSSSAYNRGHGAALERKVSHHSACTRLSSRNWSLRRLSRCVS